MVFAVLMCALPVSQSFAENISVPINRSELLGYKQEVSRVMVANPSIADIVTHGKNKVSIIGKSIGKTTVTVLDKNSDVISDITVNVTHDLPELRRLLKDFLPTEDVGVEVVGEKIALTGFVVDAEASHKALRIARNFVKQSVQSSGSSGGITSGATTTGSKDPDDSGVINLLKVRSGQQVMLRVRVGEIQRSTLKKLGVSLGIGADRGRTDINFESGGQDLFSPDGSFTRALGETGLGVVWGSGSVDVEAALDALEQDGLFKVLAEPNLVAVSGETAEFLAGGEFPIPVDAENDRVTIEFKQFGVSVQFTPYVLNQNRIRLAVQPEVSELTEAGSVTINNISIPGISARRAKTTVELAPGESFMIAGLIKDELTSTVKETPGIAEVPLLSSLFRGTEFSRTETELVIAVTPYLVDPMVSRDVRLPTDDFRPASMMETIFYGALGSVQNGVLNKAQQPRFEGPVGFMVD
jgi:pilus assembly protein CpaC